MTKKGQIGYLLIPLVVWLLGKVVFPDMPFDFLSAMYGVSGGAMIVITAIFWASQEFNKANATMRIALIMATIAILLYFIA